MDVFNKKNKNTSFFNERVNLNLVLNILVKYKFLYSYKKFKAIIMLKKILNKPKHIIVNYTSIPEVLNGLYNIKHHWKYSMKPNRLKENKAQLKYYLTKQYHIVEKGLALPKPKPGYGQAKIINLIEKSKYYENSYGQDEIIVSIKNTLKEYLKFNQNEGYQLPIDFNSTILGFIGNADQAGCGGVKIIHKETSSSLSLEKFDAFAKSRVSVRDFSDDDVSDSLILSVVKTAQYTPSVCNRQAWKVHYYNDTHRIKELLSYQNGNRGFTECVNKLVIVTGNTYGFTPVENNQLFIDGGLFSMNLLLALHASGLGACPLNTCYTFITEQKVKKIAHIPDNERLIMMIAIGNLKNKYYVASSNRNSVEDVFIPH